MYEGKLPEALEKLLSELKEDEMLHYVASTLEIAKIVPQLAGIHWIPLMTAAYMSSVASNRLLDMETHVARFRALAEGAEFLRPSALKTDGKAH